ncbi:SDR family oxidoreductase [Hoeflea alexandrii]|uniref:SDR family oxidoreductase n=1 Tax=Hoeflea alexandrii TaxID=288436 RepID=UPI0022AFA138|nr:SDR family oxidoreductase [Hoeflea alexandrii]MCZ4291641.1 SDR family oxidoreductase [Hoeflea alexandrii]
MSHMEGKTAVILGGTGGIGSAVTRRLAAAGCKVISASVDAEEKRSALEAETGAICAYLDVRDREAVVSMLRPLAPDYLVLAHGALGRTGTLFDQPAESARRLVDVNILGVQNCLEAVVPAMIARNDGHVVMIGSVALYPSVGQPIYSATKAAVHSMARNLRMELFPHRVRVTEIRPGRVSSGMHAEMFEGGYEEAKRRLYDPVHCLTPDEIAEGIIWALSKPAHLCVAELEILATEHVIGGVRYNGI